MDVVIPQAGQQPASVEIYSLGVGGRHALADLSDAALDDDVGDVTYWPLVDQRIRSEEPSVGEDERRSHEGIISAVILGQLSVLCWRHADCVATMSAATDSVRLRIEAADCLPTGLVETGNTDNSVRRVRAVGVSPVSRGAPAENMDR